MFWQRRETLSALSLWVIFFAPPHFLLCLNSSRRHSDEASVISTQWRFNSCSPLYRERESSGNHWCKTSSHLPLLLQVLRDCTHCPTWRHEATISVLTLILYPFNIYLFGLKIAQTVIKTLGYFICSHVIANLFEWLELNGKTTLMFHGTRVIQ